MPKEITHWIVSMKTAEALRGTLIGDAALTNQNALKFGAIYQDIFYHLPIILAASRYREIAYSLHGTNGEDPYDLIRQIMSTMQESPYREQLLAFLLGIATHIHTDAVFHPMVYYVTGNTQNKDASRRSEAIQQHRCIESLMDIYFCGNSRDIKKYSFQAFLKDLEMPLSQIRGLLPQGESQNNPLPDVYAVFLQALRNLRILQKWYSRPMLARFLYVSKPFLFRTAREIACLFYAPQLEKMIPLVSGTLNYRNAITGHINKSTLTDLLNEAVIQSCIVARKIEEKMTDGTVSNFCERGPSLRYGIIGAAANSGMYFSEKQFFS
jgi:hypothetical protein